MNAQVPWELAGQSQTTFTATINGQTSTSQTVNLATYVPGIFAVNSEGTGQGAILDANYHLVDASNPAIPYKALSILAQPKTYIPVQASTVGQESSSGKRGGCDVI